MKLSIITINLNHAAGLRRTLDSVAVQTFLDFELIVIDGGSTDGSLDLIRERRALITHWVSEQDKGIYHGMNKGLQVARGDYLYFLNSGDELLSPSTLARIFGHGDYSEDLLYGNTMRPDRNGKPYECSHPDILTIDTFWGFGVCQQAIFYKRHLFDKLGHFDESFRLAGDMEFNLRLLMSRCSTRHLPFPVARYEGGGISATRQDLSAQEKEIALRRHLPEAVYRDYERFKILERNHGRLKQYEDWANQIRTRNPLLNLAMIAKWSWENYIYKPARKKHPASCRVARRPGKPLNIGFVSIWHVRGITFVAKQLADAMEGPGIQTHVLSRWEADKFTNREPVSHPRITFGGDDPSPELVTEWAQRSNLDAVIFCEVHSNDWKRVEALRKIGVRVIATEMLDMLKLNSFGDYGIFDAFLHIAFETNRVFRKKHPRIPSLVIPWGIPSASGTPPPPKAGSTLRYMHVAGWGGLNNRKNTDVLLKAWELASPRHGTLTIYTQAPAERYGDEGLRIINNVQGIELREGTIPDIRTAYADADLLLWPSKREGLGLPILEAASCGLPSVISDGYMMKQWGLPGEHVLVCPATPSRTGQYLPELTVQAKDLADIISRLDNDPEAVRHMQESVQRDHDLWNWSWQPDVLKQQITALIEQPGHKPDVNLSYLPTALLEFEAKRRRAYGERHAGEVSRLG